ncbi:MAG: chromate transporter [Rikenellaceae bacterium]|nr:chromate transporter [Rikenellaceae bacterium]MDE7355875.1 chromate transporter [Rikenellaceae bacterium]
MKETLKIFTSFFKIGCFTFGGGYAMILLMQREIGRHGWVNDEEFLNYLSLAQASPGPMAVNTAILIGYHRKGVIGGIAGFLGSVLPSFIILLTIAIFFRSLYQYPATKSVFMGMRPAVVALILYPVFSFSKNITRKEIPIVIAVAAGIWFGLSPVIFIIAAVVWGIVYCRHKLKQTQQRNPKDKQ